MENNPIENLPEAIQCPIQMDKANEIILIFEGEYWIRNDTQEIKMEGKIQFEWFPKAGVYFYGKTEIHLNKSVEFILGTEYYKVIINGLEFGEGLIINANIDNYIPFIAGFIRHEAILGDRSIAVEKIKFSIPNLRGFYGKPIKSFTNNKPKITHGRLRLKNNDFIITIDQSPNYKDLYSSLKSMGGYVNLFGGELERKNNSILLTEVKDIINCFNAFITFLNGRRTSILFIHGSFDNEMVWTDYSSYLVDNFKQVQSWPQRSSIKGLNNLWNNFSTIWKDKEDRAFLKSLIHWYVEANGHSGFSEGSIIMAQTGLELIYNWFIIEKLKLILGKDSENINAANKIRLVLSQLQMNSQVPEGLTHLTKFVAESKEILDGPDAVVQIRNAIVHSQQEKRKKVNAISSQTKFEALQLCIWYIEMAFLKILNYEEKYHNRCSEKVWAGDTEEFTPWSKNKHKQNKEGLVG